MLFGMCYGTVFENTQKPLRLWFHVMWLMMSQKTGVSSKIYKTLWGLVAIKQFGDGYINYGASWFFQDASYLIVQ